MALHRKTTKFVKSFLSNFYLAIEWRIIATTITFIAAYIVSGSITVSLEIASVEIIIKIIVQAFWLKYRVRRNKAETAVRVDG